MNQELLRKTHERYIGCRHYNDETAAYESDSWYRMMAKVTRAFDKMYELERETGDVTVRPDLTDETLNCICKELEEAEAALIRLHDPEEDKLYLWEGDRMPWDQFTLEEWGKLSVDAPDFRPHMTMHPVRDGKRHPVILIVGGRFRYTAMEGHAAAKFLNEHGYHAFLLHNRMASGEKIRHSLERALDLQRAIRLIRAKADELNIDPDKIGFWGLSMGNRPAIDLINRMGIHADPHSIDAEYIPDEVDKMDASLNAYISEYPATFPWDAPNKPELFPPTFGIAGNRDASMWRMIPFFADLLANKCCLELHVIDGVSHGFSMGDYSLYTTNPMKECYDSVPEYVEEVTMWPELLLMWLKRVFSDEFHYQWPIDPSWGNNAGEPEPKNES